MECTREVIKVMATIGGGMIGGSTTVDPVVKADERKKDCWCEKKILKGGDQHRLSGRLVTFYYCPECGRKL